MTTEKKKKYRVTAPNGEVFTRATFRTYTYAVLIREPDDKPFLYGGPEQVYGVLGFCGTKELADKLARKTKYIAWDAELGRNVERNWVALVVPVEEV
jgi:hypothetical protein